VRLVYDVEAVGRIERHDVHGLAQFADVFHAGLRSGVYLVEILVGNAEFPGKNARDARLTRPTAPGEEVGMRDLLVLDGFFEHVDDVGLPAHLLEACRPVRAV